MKMRSYFVNALIPALLGLILGELLMILVFDYIFCMLGGLAGFHLATGGRAQ